MGSFFAKLPIRNKYLFLIFVSELKRSNSKQNGNNKFFQIATNHDLYRGVDGISVLKTHKPDESSEGRYFIVFGCSDMYSQVKEKSFTATFNGLD